MQGERLAMTKKELMNLARQRGIQGYGAMSKTELEVALDLSKSLEPAEKIAEPAPRAKVLNATPAANGKTTQKIESAKPSASADIEASEKVLVVASTTANTASEKGEELAQVEAPTATPIVAEKLEEAPEEDKPQGPPLKQTWTNHQLLIDDDLSELPKRYQDDRAVLMVRDPLWLHAYWDLSPESVALAKKRGGKVLTLRVHDVTHVIFDGTNSHHRFDIAMPFDHQRIWYLNVPSDDRTYLFEIGYKRADSYFVPLAISNPATTPKAEASQVIRDRFATMSEAPGEQAVIRQLPSAPGGSRATHPAGAPQAAFPQAFEALEGSEVLQAPLTPAPEQPGIGISEDMYALSLRGKPYWSADIPKFGDYLQYPAPSSFATSSWQGGVPQPLPQAPKAAPRGKDFWLVANCELVVYGATEPDARVTVCGQAIELRPDGSFTLRFELPDGLHPIPIHAVNADQDDERAITITVTRDTTVGF